MAELINPDPLPPQRRRVLLLAMSPAQLLDVAGPAEVLAQAGRLHAIERISVRIPGSCRPRFREIVAHCSELKSPGIPI